MKKSELLELLKTLNDDAEVNEVLQGVEGLIKPLDINSIGLDQFKNVLESNKEIRAYYQSALDSGIGKGVATFKEKTLPGILEEELKKAANKDKTPEQIEIENLKKQFEEAQSELKREKTVSKYSKVLKEKNLPVELVDFIYGNGEEETINKNIETINSVFNTAVNSAVKGKLGEGAYTPPSGEGASTFESQLATAMGVK